MNFWNKSKTSRLYKYDIDGKYDGNFTRMAMFGYSIRIE